MKKAILRKKLAEERGEITITPTLIKVDDIDDIIVKSIQNKEEVVEKVIKESKKNSTKKGE